jgi:predicted component of type VI protein secretion system
MPPQLVALTEGPDLLLDKPILLLGRHQECDIQLNSRKISRRHCCIAQVNNQLVIRDLASTNGIRINGQRVAEGHLKPGDQLTIGNYQYRLTWEDQPAPPAQPPPAGKPAGPDPPALDEALLSCDLPMPLDEPRPGLQPPHRKEKDAPAEPPPPRIVPDDLGLAPLSDMLPNHSPKPGSRG